MAIVKMNKFTLLAFESQRAELLEKLQDFSEVEFTDLQSEVLNEENVNEEYEGLDFDNAGSSYEKCEEKLSKAKSTLKFLKEYVPQKSMIKSMREGKRELTLKELEKAVLNSPFDEICSKVKDKENELAALESEKSKLQTEIESLKLIENFDAPLESLNDLKTPVFFGSIPKQYMDELAHFDDYYIEIVSENDQDVYFLSMCNEDQKEELEEKLRSFGFSPFKTTLKEKPIEIIQNNMDSIEKIKSKEFFVKEELASFDEDVNTLELICEYYENIVTRKNAVDNFLRTNNVVIIKGWLPSEENKNFVSLLKEVLGEDYYIDFSEVTDEDIESGIVPVKLKNNELNSAFEDITKMYSTPRYNEIDPTPLLTPFYLLFFGMMVADMGYGLLEIIVVGLALKFFKFDESKRRFAKFFFYLGFPIFGFGLIYGTVFGVELPIPGHISQTNDINTVLIASIVFGAIQIFVGLGIKAYMLIRDGKVKDAFYDVFSWYFALIGTGLLLGSMLLGLPAIAKNIGIVLMVIGMGTIVLTNGRGAKSKVAQIGSGAYELYGITSYIGDLVSYTRLMALGLSGGSLAAAFNMMAGMIPGVAMFLFAPLILVFGHIFNLGLSLLGAYVHTCRLQYVEYFGKFYEGGGKDFTPFKAKNEYINTKKEEIIK
ncbi:MAG: V-type ATP synthase subunit I [Clostridiales bacterium]|nr:V-type ATP synthase subunit I [Clostridium sp.]NLK24521.1 V-type ATP synthase subunit I [Clostridiales bacterium]